MIAPMTCVLSFDPGITTGWALLNRNGRIVGCGEVKSEEIGKFLSETVFRNYMLRDFRFVYMEDTPIPTGSDLNRRMRQVIDSIVGVFGDRLVRVKPGVWKNSWVTEVPIDSHRLLSPHEKDAVLIARWGIAKKFGRESITKEG